MASKIDFAPYQKLQVAMTQIRRLAHEELVALNANNALSSDERALAASKVVRQATAGLMRLRQRVFDQYEADLEASQAIVLPEVTNSGTAQLHAYWQQKAADLFAGVHGDTAASVLRRALASPTFKIDIARSELIAAARKAAGHEGREAVNAVAQPHLSPDEVDLADTHAVLAKLGLRVGLLGVAVDREISKIEQHATLRQTTVGEVTMNGGTTISLGEIGGHTRPPLTAGDVENDLFPKWMRTFERAAEVAAAGGDPNNMPQRATNPAGVVTLEPEPNIQPYGAGDVPGAAAAASAAR
ncbi:MAG TPA: hypothetical protein VHD87_08140 [Acidimicrobiales bacterium]|nr:hypothetical protein [Acidimicrobiales bacterium]